MTTPILPLNDITHTAIEVLCRELGVVNTARFLNQFSLGFGNYTTERDTLFADLSVDDIIAAISHDQQSGQNAA